MLSIVIVVIIMSEFFIYGRLRNLSFFPFFDNWWQYSTHTAREEPKSSNNKNTETRKTGYKTEQKSFKNYTKQRTTGCTIQLQGARTNTAHAWTRALGERETTKQITPLSAIVPSFRFKTQNQKNITTRCITHVFWLYIYKVILFVSKIWTHNKQ